MRSLTRHNGVKHYVQRKDTRGTDNQIPVVTLLCEISPDSHQPREKRP